MKLTKIAGNITSRMTALRESITRIESYPPISTALNMSSQDCYELFGMGNETLEEVENLVSTLENGLYDDAQLAFVKVNGHYILTYTYDEDCSAVTSGEVLSIIYSISNATDFYNRHSSEINGGDFIWKLKDPTHPVKKWEELKKVADDVKRSYGWDESDDMKRLKADLEGRMNEYKQSKGV